MRIIINKVNKMKTIDLNGTAIETLAQFRTDTDTHKALMHSYYHALLDFQENKAESYDSVEAAQQGYVLAALDSRIKEQGKTIIECDLTYVETTVKAEWNDANCSIATTITTDDIKVTIVTGYKKNYVELETKDAYLTKQVPEADRSYRRLIEQAITLLELGSDIEETEKQLGRVVKPLTKCN